MRPVDERMPLKGVQLLAIDPFPTRSVEALVAHVSRRLPLPCTLRYVALQGDAPLLPGREQIDSDDLLARLEALEAEPGVIIVGLTSRDLGTRIFTFVFGRARRGGHAALVSTARLDPSYYGLPDEPGLTERRAVAEIVHEVGHVAGLDHCREPSCVMRFATNVESIDLRGAAFCEECMRRLPPGLAGTADHPPPRL